MKFATQKCVKWSKMKISRSNSRNEPVRLKNIRLGTRAVRYISNVALWVKTNAFMDTKVPGIGEKIFPGQRTFHFSKRLKLISIFFEVGKYHSWPNIPTFGSGPRSMFPTLSTYGPRPVPALSIWQSHNIYKNLKFGPYVGLDCLPTT